MSVCVIGAGIMGLPTALKIQQLEPRTKVTIVAEKFSPFTTSDFAAGHWRPFFLQDPRSDLLQRWGEETFRVCSELWKDDPLKFGVNFGSGYELFERRMPLEEEYWTETVYEYRRLTHKDLRNYQWDRDFVFLANGGSIEKQRVSTISQVVERDRKVVVNCSGLGSYHLVDDKTCYPVRGQIMRVRAPFQRHHCILGDDNYVLPNQEKIVLGGTHQSGDWNTAVSPTDSNAIWNGVVKHCPWLKLVHNYGHGGSGITLHEGCANDAANLAVAGIHRPSAKL